MRTGRLEEQSRGSIVGVVRTAAGTSRRRDRHAGMRCPAVPRWVAAWDGAAGVARSAAESGGFPASSARPCSRSVRALGRVVLQAPQAGSLCLCSGRPPMSPAPRAAWPARGYRLERPFVWPWVRLGCGLASHLVGRSCSGSSAGEPGRCAAMLAVFGMTVGGFGFGALGEIGGLPFCMQWCCARQACGHWLQPFWLLHVDHDRGRCQGCGDCRSTVLR